MAIVAIPVYNPVSPGGSVYAGIDPAPYFVPSGAIVTLATVNTRADVNPRNDPALNPNHPSAAPWEASAGWGANGLSAFCGGLMCEGIGAAGTYMTYAATGHSTNLEACCWLGFDVAELRWKLITDPLPTPVINASLWDPGVYPPTSQFDATWGDWVGDSDDWPEAFRQAGYNPPMGSHTRNSYVYIPPADAGNTKGKIVVAWQPTGNNSGTGIRGSWVFDADTGLFSRTADLRPSSGSDVTGVAYAPDSGIVIGHNFVSSTTSADLDFLDLSDLTWTRRTGTNAIVVRIDSTNFVIGDLFVMVRHEPSGDPVMTFWAAPISTVKAGGSWGWVQLDVDAASFPVYSDGRSWMVAWARCPTNGAFYAVNRINGSSTIWKLTPPTTDGDTSGLLSGEWTITSETLDGTLVGTLYDYSRLQWSTALNAFLWYADPVDGPVQAIRPIGV